MFVVVCTLHSIEGVFDSGLDLNFVWFSFRFRCGCTLDLLLEVVHHISYTVTGPSTAYAASFMKNILFDVSFRHLFTA